MAQVIFGLVLALACPVAMWLLTPGGSAAQPASSADEVARLRAEVDQLQAAQRDAAPTNGRSHPRPM